MRKHFYNVRDFLLPIIDFFYPPFKKLMNLQTFHYAVSGSANTFSGLLVYYITYRFILQREDFDLGFYAFKSHNAALFLSFCVTFVVGFFLMKYVVFDDSKARGSVQLAKYFFVCIFNLVLNYFLLKLAVEHLHIYPVFAQIGTTLIVVVVSYMAQRYFTFRKTPEKTPEPVYVEEE
ncbi:MAG: GtrA family protein [Niabella sp.]